MQVLHAHPVLGEVVGEFLGHPFCEGSDEDSLLFGCAYLNLVYQVVDLPTGWADLNRGINETGRPDDLLNDDPLGSLDFIRPRGGRDVDHLVHAALELGKGQRAIVKGGRETESVLDQSLLPGAVSPVHAVKLRDRLVGLIDDDQGILREIVHKRRRGFPGHPAGEMARVVLDALARSDLSHHFEIKEGPLPKPLGLEEFPLCVKPGGPLCKLLLNGGEGALSPLFRSDVMVGGVDGGSVELLQLGPGQRVDLPQALHLIPPKFHADCSVRISREDLHHVPPDPEGSPVKVVVVSLVLDLDELPEHLVTLAPSPLLEEHHHAVVRLGGPQPIDTRDGCDDDHIAPFQERASGRVAEFVDVLVDHGILLDEGVGLRDIGLRLVIVVIADKVLDRIVGEEALELVVELGGQRFVMGNDQSRPLDRRDDVGHRKGFPRPGHS